ncbi:MAG: S8 family serine peptidase [Phycisphaerales bacterium]|nr:S8 family serine peptidase [Phycisphaerales bacterium]
MNRKKLVIVVHLGLIGFVMLTVAHEIEAQQNKSGQNPDNLQTTSGDIRWQNGMKTGQFKTAAQTAQTIADLSQAQGGLAHLVVQFDKHPSDKAELQAAGLTLLSYLGNNAFFASTSQPNVQALSNISSLRFASLIDVNDKMHSRMSAGAAPPWVVVSRTEPQSAEGDDAEPDETSEDIVVAYVIFHRDVPAAADGPNIAARCGAKIRSILKTINGAVIEIPKSGLTTLAGEDGVQWIEYPLPALGPNNDDNRTRTQANIVQSPPYDLNGEGVTVLVYDVGVARETHVDFGNRLTARDPGFPNDHPTHVSGTIGGDGTASNGQYAGMAPNVRIESYGFDPEFGFVDGALYTDPGDIETDYDEAINVYGADVANNSIGANVARNGSDCDWEGDYGVTSSVIDSIVVGGLGTPFRIVWSNGNERGNGRCGTDYHTTPPPACAKNHITVGALNSNDDSVTSFTSWGPADDGRLKPDISGPGCERDGDMGAGVTSTGNESDTDYRVACGTSMSAPTVTGLCALMLQDIRTRYPGNADPRNSTLKALLAHNAEDIENVGPDYMTGYGSVRIQDTIDFVASGNYLEDSVSHGASVTYSAVVGKGAKTLKATLAWDDAVGTPNVIPSLVNDLDLRMFSPAGVRHYPWTLGGLSDPAAPAVRTTEDHINNIEQVLVDNPEFGKWTIEVHGFEVPEGPQSFSLAVSPDLAFDCNGNLIEDRCDLDCELCGALDCGQSEDCTGNGIPDECEPDCDGNGVADSCDIAVKKAEDCNLNGILDVCDIASGSIPDCNGNKIPDDCEVDCNKNAVPDDCDITSGMSGDCNLDGVPDECEVAACCREGNCTMETPSQCEGFVCNVGNLLPETFTGCYGDVNGDGTVNGTDRAQIYFHFGSTDPGAICLCDLDGDGVIDTRDREIINSYFGDCVPLPDHQNGSGLKIDGTRDLRFGGGIAMGPCTDCATITCESFGACCSESGLCTTELESRCEEFTCNLADLLPATFTGCYGDINGDGVVDTADRDVVSLYFGETDPLWLCLYDVNGDGVINGADRGFITAVLGECIPLPDFQDGSGLNGGVPDIRFVRTFLGSDIPCVPDLCEPCPCLGDVNSDGQVDAGDTQGFVDCALTGQGVDLTCSCTDLNGDLLVDGADIDLFVSRMLEMSGACVDLLAEDCNGNGTPDYVDFTLGVDEDCNDNDVLDRCDITSGTSQDMDANGVPDECQLGACCVGCECVFGTLADCNQSSFVCDVAAIHAALGNTNYTGCFADTDGNGVVNAADRGQITAAFGTTDPCLICLMDLDGNGVVNAADRGQVTAVFGQCLPLPPYQDGSGPFQPGEYLGDGTFCPHPDCP